MLNVDTIDVTANSAPIAITTKDISNYPSYTLKDYKLVYTFSNEQGDIVLEKEEVLPTLNPGDSWNGKISWNTLQTPYRLKVKIINPLGYERAKKEIFFHVPSTPVIKQVIAGKNKARIYFDKAFGVKEYMAAYKTATGTLRYTAPTISNFITLDSLSNKTYQVTLVAINGKGKSIPSEGKKFNTTNKLLPPVVWESFIDDKKLVIGYTSEFVDDNYTIVYGNNKNSLKETFTTNVRGMMTVDFNTFNNTPIYFKIKRTINGKDSQWSNIIETVVNKIE